MKRIKLIYGVTAILLIVICWIIRYFCPSIDEHYARSFPELFKIPIFVCVYFALFKVKYSVPRAIFYCTLACLFYECLDLMFLYPINWMRIIALLAGAGIFYVLYLTFGFKSVADYTDKTTK